LALRLALRLAPFLALLLRLALRLAPFLALLLRLALLPPTTAAGAVEGAGAELGKSEFEDSFCLSSDDDWLAPIFTKLK
jgi:hypothetical protein